MIIDNLLKDDINGKKELKILKKGGQIMNKNLFKKVICLVIALMRVMPNMPMNLVKADEDVLPSIEEPNGDTQKGIFNGTTTPPAIGGDLPEDPPVDQPEEYQYTINYVYKDFDGTLQFLDIENNPYIGYAPAGEINLPDYPEVEGYQLAEDNPEDINVTEDGLAEVNILYTEVIPVMPMDLSVGLMSEPADFTFESATEVYKLVGKSPNKKNLAQLAWIQENDDLIIAIITQTNKPIETIVFNNGIDPVQSFDSTDIIGIGDPAYKDNPGSGLIVDTPALVDEKPFFVGDFGVNLNSETFIWVVYNLGNQTPTGSFTLELYATGEGGYQIIGDNAIWKINGSLEIHKDAYEEDGTTPLDPAKEFTITITGPDSYSVTVMSGSFELLTGLKYGTYSATESVPGYTTVISSPVTLSSENVTGIITVTNTKNTNSLTVVIQDLIR